MVQALGGFRSAVARDTGVGAPGDIRGRRAVRVWALRRARGQAARRGQDSQLAPALSRAIRAWPSYSNGARHERFPPDTPRDCVPRPWLSPPAVLTAAGALALLAGLAVAIVGSAAALGLVAYLVAPIVTVVRPR